MHRLCFLLPLTTPQIIIIIIIIIIMRKLRANVVPVITGANGTISESVIQNVINVMGKHEIKELQKQP